MRRFVHFVGADSLYFKGDSNISGGARPNTSEKTIEETERTHDVNGNKLVGGATKHEDNDLVCPV